MLIYTPITPAGSPAMVASAAKDAIAPPGTPGVPTERSTFARSTITIMEMLTLIPHALAKNMIMKDMMNNIMTQTLTIDEAIEKADAEITEAFAEYGY